MKDRVRKELLGYMVEKDIIKAIEYYTWDDLDLKYRALSLTKALQMLGVI